MEIAKVKGIITKKRKYEAVKIHNSFPGWNIKPIEQEMSYNTRDNKNCSNCNTGNPHNHHRDDKIFELYSTVWTLHDNDNWNCKTAINAGLLFPPIAVIARKIWKETSVCVKRSELIERTPNPIVIEAMSMLASTKWMVPQTALATTTKDRTTVVKNRTVA